MAETGGGLLAVLVLVFVNGFFVAAEFALVTIRRTRVEQMLAERRPGARNVEDATTHLDSYIAACQLGVTMASLALGWVGEPALAGLVQPVLGEVAGHAFGVAVSFVLITAILVMVGELTPKGIALQYPEQTSIIVAGPLRAFRNLFRPIIWLLNEGGWITQRLLGVRRDADQHGAHISAEELRLVVQASAQAGAIETEEQFMLDRVLKFGDISVASVMIPRTEVVALQIDTTTEQATAMVAEHHHSRYPVYRKDLDDILGVIHVRDLLLATPSDTLRPLLREAVVVPSNVGVDRLLAEMRSRRNHFAIAVDEFGGTDGIVTLEDVLESIVGELQDEFEEPERRPQRGPGGRLRIDGLDNVDVLPGLLGFEVEAGPYNTVAGYVLDRIGRIPQVGDAIEVEGYRLRVAEMDDLRIAAIEAEPLNAPRAQEAAP